MSGVARLAKQSGVYALGNAIVKAGGLLLLLLYLDPALLAQAEYGRLALLETAAGLALAVAGLGLAQGLLKFATDPAHHDERDALTFTAWLGVVALAFALWGGFAVAARPLAAWLLDDAARAPLVRLVGGYAALKVVGAVPYMVLRMDERVVSFVALLVAELAALVGGVYYFVAVRGWGLEGAVLGLALSAAVAAVPPSLVLLARVPWRFRPALARRLVAFGAPLVFANFANILLNTGDRFVLEALRGADAVAVYALAQKFGGLVNMLFVQSFSLAFAVLGLKALGSLAEAEGEVGELHRKTFRHYAVLAGWGVLGVSLLAFDVTAAISPNRAYLEAAPLVLPIGLGFLAYGVYYIMMNVLYAAGQTGRIAGNVLGAALANLVLNAALIPPLGAMGAAAATLLAYAGLAAVTARQARGIARIAFPWRVLATAVLLVAGLWGLGQPAAAWATPVRLGWRLGLLALYPALVLVAGVYTRAELGSLAASARTWLARTGARS